jgi:DNA-binding LacI/PurR family transcriptional regulator
MAGRNQVTLDDVAQRAQVSRTTASMVLNNKARRMRISEACIARVRKAAEDVGYIANYHAVSMRLGKANTIGMVLNVGGYVQGRRPVPLDENPYYAGLVFGAEGAAHERGYDFLLIGPGPELQGDERGVTSLRQKQVDSLVLTSSGRTSVPGLAEGLRKFVAIQPAAELGIPSVGFDQAGGVNAMVEHLAGHGHRNVLWLGQESLQDRELLLHRAAGKADMRVNSVSFALDPVEEVLDTGSTYGEYHVDQAAKALKSVLGGKPEFTAIAASSDWEAAGAIRVLSQEGLRVGRDVSVIGWDNSLVAQTCSPGITTIDHRFAEMGYQAGLLAVEIAQCDPGALDALARRVVTVEPRLVRRGSTGPAPR